eukprot:3712013-Pleurochrysis_carterae.AAC.1
MRHARSRGRLRLHRNGLRMRGAARMCRFWYLRSLGYYVLPGPSDATSRFLFVTSMFVIYQVFGDKGARSLYIFEAAQLFHNNSSRCRRAMYFLRSSYASQLVQTQFHSYFTNSTSGSYNCCRILYAFPEFFSGTTSTQALRMRIHDEAAPRLLGLQHVNASPPTH